MGVRGGERRRKRENVVERDGEKVREGERENDKCGLDSRQR